MFYRVWFFQNVSEKDAKLKAYVDRYESDIGHCYRLIIRRTVRDYYVIVCEFFHSIRASLTISARCSDQSRSREELIKVRHWDTVNPAQITVRDGLHSESNLGNYGVMDLINAVHCVFNVFDSLSWFSSPNVGYWSRSGPSSFFLLCVSAWRSANSAKSARE